MTDVHTIPESLYSKYRGTGNGTATFDEDDQLIDIEYEQEIEMRDDAGRIVSEEQGRKVITCNFSSYEVCLF